MSFRPDDFISDEPNTRARYGGSLEIFERLEQSVRRKRMPAWFRSAWQQESGFKAEKLVTLACEQTRVDNSQWINEAARSRENRRCIFDCFSDPTQSGNATVSRGCQNGSNESRGQTYRVCRACPDAFGKRCRRNDRWYRCRGRHFSHPFAGCRQRDERD